MSEGYQKVTIKGLGKELGLHHTTVSKALRGSTQISEKTRLKVSELAQKLCYQPNQIARSLRSSSTTTLGVIFPYVTPPYYATLLDALGAAADQRGLHLEVHFHQWNCQQEVEEMKQLIERRVMGALICPAGPSSLRTLAGVIHSQAGFPVVLLTSAFSGVELPSFVTARVASDLRHGALALGRHLLERGHRRVAVLIPTSLGETIESNVRVAGLREALRAVPSASLSVITVPAMEADEAAEDGKIGQSGLSAGKNLAIAEALAERFLQQTPRPTAVVTGDEPIAHVLLARLYAAKVRVPEEVSVACFGGTYLSEFGMLPLTCVKQAVERMAETALEFVASNAGRHKPRSPIVHLLEPTLVIRDSVAWRPVG